MSSHAPIGSDPSAAKRRQIIDGARQVFSEHGFERATVDQIAARAGVSKATVYNHFEDKRALFVAAVVGGCAEFRETLACAAATGSGDDPESVLRALGDHLLSRWLSPAVVRLYRQAIAESERMPDIGKLVFERGTLPLQELIADHLRRWSEAGTLRLDDARGAAICFIALLQGDLVIRARLGVLTPPVDAQIRETVDRAVSTFLRAFRS